MTKYRNKDIMEFLDHSNRIEREYTGEALVDAKKAWDYAVENFKKKWGHKYILGIHKQLCQRVDPEIAGKFRDCDVYIGGERKLFISLEILAGQVKSLCKDHYDPNKVFTEREIKGWHLGFEGLHPFIDGNGRTGRILMNVQRMYSNLPILIVHEDYDQFEYYRWFNKSINNPYTKCELCDIWKKK